MEAIKIAVTGNTAAVTQIQAVTAGTVGLPVEFSFDDSWTGLEKTAVFRCGSQTLDRLQLTDKTTVPWELVKKTGCRLWAGVYGCSSDGSVQIPTVWVDLGVILPGADPAGEEGAEPTLPLWAQLFEKAEYMEEALEDQHGQIRALQEQTSDHEDKINENNASVQWAHRAIGSNRIDIDNNMDDIAALQTHATYQKLYDTVTVTDGDIAAAGEAGITVITVGSDKVDLSSYQDILIRLWVPKDEALNSENGMLWINLTGTSAYDASSANKLLTTQSLGISSVCSVTPDKDNVFAIKTVWCEDTFLYGQVMKNGYGSSDGYAGAQNAWTDITTKFKKSEKKYFHILAYNATTKVNNKFPAGTWVEVYGR